MKQFAIAIIVITLCFGCTSRQKQSDTPKSYHFRYVQAPTLATPEQQAAYLRDHYWDKFDFADTLYCTKADTVEMLHAYANYVQNFVGPIDQEPIRKLMQ